MPELRDICAFIAETAGVRESVLKPDCDLEQDASVAGDDFSELMEAFEKRFSVDMSSYLWYFHHDEEVSFNPGALVFKPPSRRVPRISVTPETLLQAANSGRWSITYPEHELPKRRYDILLTYAFFMSFILVLVLSALRRWAGA